MSTSQFETNVSIRWWPATEQTEVNASDKDSLEDFAMDHVNRMVADGFREGDLSTTLLVGGDEDSRSYRGYWRYTEDQPSAKVYELPFGVRIQTTSDGGVQMSSTLSEQFMAEEGYLDEKAQACAEALETLLRAMACAGVDLDDPKIKAALESAVHSIAGEMDYEVSPETFSNQQIDWSQPMSEIKKQITEITADGSENGEPNLVPQRLKIEDAGGVWGYVYCMFRAWRGEHYMDIERRVIVRKDFEGWRDCFDAECRDLKSEPHSYDDAKFVSICQA